MKILVINCGSSSFKYQLIDMQNENVIAKGNFERIGINGSFLTHKVNGEKYVYEFNVSNHEEAINFVIDKLTDEKIGVVKSLDEISAIGHRVLHAGEAYFESVLVDEDVKQAIRDAVVFGPLHNPANLQGIEACERIFKGKPNVAVFDTAFHQTMPKHAYIYPIPYEYYEKYGIRKYGFHGTSHRYISKRISEILGRDDLKVINCHLGQGASLCAIKNGKCIDTTMGLTPLGGIPMGTRSGDLDPSVVTFLMKKENLTPDEMENILNKKSGMLGMSQISSDARDIKKEALENNEQAMLTEEIYCYLISGYIARYAAALDGVDVIVFTAGIGENANRLRAKICSRLKFMNVKIDNEINDNGSGKETKISSEDSGVLVYIIPTNEELMIARDTRDIVSKL